MRPHVALPPRVDMRIALGLILLPFFLVFIGDVQVPVGASTMTVPMGIFIILPLLGASIMLPRITVPTSALLLSGIIIFGAAGVAMTPEGQYMRAAAGALPLVYAICTLIFYAQVYQFLKQEWIVRMMLAGGAVLAIGVVLLFFVAVLSPGDYYARKLFVATPLGRSNYLAAFLVFLFALASARMRVMRWLFALAIFCTMSRGGVIIFALFLLALQMDKKRLLWLVWVVPLVAFVSAILFFSIDIQTQLREYDGLFASELSSVVNRLLLWSFSFDLWLQHPWFGIGPNTFRTFIELNHGIEDVWGTHNSILQLLLNYGLFGAILYGWYLRVIYRHLLRAEQTTPWFRYLRVVFVVLLVFSLFEPLVGSAAFEVLLAFMLVLALTHALPAGSGRLIIIAISCSENGNIALRCDSHAQSLEVCDSCGSFHSGHRGSQSGTGRQ
ncbi:O-antigen ligase family protein [Achromobacter spanius]|uniref:O-antigen ligase family protein n=1 Tax=Achromobacter spanius TaxID=217203 RepID=UPI0037F1B102